MRTKPLLLATGLLGLAACGPDAETRGFFGGSASNLDSICVDEAENIPEGSLRCGETRSYECGINEPDQLYVSAADLGQMTCGTSTLTVSDSGPFEVGTHPIDVLEETTTGTVTSTMTVCTSTITIVDTKAPEVTEKDFEIWPPNHRMVKVAPEDCAAFYDACAGDDVDFEFTYVVVDEAENGRGDGNTAPDVELGCDGSLKVRAERAGPGDGRVYRIGFQIDDGNGNRITGVCRASVPHDRSGRPAVEGAEVYRVESDDRVCDDDDDGKDDDDCVCDDDDDYYADDDDDDDDDDDGYDDDDDDDRGGRDHGTVNNGPLPDGCVKLEGTDIGTMGTEYFFGHNSVIIDGWTTKTDDPGDYVGFEYTLTSTPAFVSVKAGGDVFTDYATDTSTDSWSHPEGKSGPKAKGISNIVFCEENPFADDDDDCPEDGHDGDDDDDDL
jgi:hypothetical protein